MEGDVSRQRFTQGNRSEIPLCGEKGASPSVSINSWLIYWMLKISHLTLDFPLSYLQIQCLLKGHFCLTELLQWEVTFYRWWPEALIEETQQEVCARRLSAADTTQPRLVLKTSPSSTRPLRFPKLLMTCHFCNWFADDFLWFQKTRTNGTKFSLDMYGPSPASTRSELVPQEFKCAEEASWWKLKSSLENSSCLSKFHFFCLVFVIKGAVSPHTWSPIAEPFLQSHIKLVLENPSWWVFMSLLSQAVTQERWRGGRGGGFPSKYPLSDALHMSLCWHKLELEECHWSQSFCLEGEIQ